MRNKIANWKIVNLFFFIIFSAVLIFGTAVSVCAVDNKYTFSDIKMSIKIPRDYITITKDFSRDEQAFETLDLDYDETITAFKSAGIYLQAYDENKITKITLTVASDDDSKKINNYSDITATQRQQIIDAFLEDETYLTGVEKKHGGNIFLDFTLKNEDNDKTLYASQCNTVINGMNINLTMQKSGESFDNDDNKVLDSIAESISFDKITLKTGPAFDWWRVVLVLAIMAAIAVAVSYIYKQYNEAKRRKLKERRDRSRMNNQQKLAQVIEEETKTSTDTFNEENLSNQEQEQPYQPEQLTFDELLGYQDENEYKERAATDLESYDINVKEKNVNAGMDYFEDSGDSINNSVDYFDSYFKESTKHRSVFSRFFSILGAYIKIAFNHTRYFFKNLGKMISEIFKGKQKKN